jgi:hypothetical protein
MSDSLAAFAIIEPPPAMVADISSFCIGAYAHKILGMLRERQASFKNKVAAEKLEQFFLTHIRKMGPKQMSVGANQIDYKSSLNFDGWACPFGDAKQIEDILRSRGFGAITCQLHFTGSEKYSGLWISGTRTLEVHTKIPDLKTINDFWKEANEFSDKEASLSETIEHELIHMVQLIGFYIRSTKDIIGLPPRAMKDNKQPFAMLPGAKRIEESVSQELNDAEFYPSLMDAINKFARLASYIAPNLRREYLKSFIGSHNVDVKLFPADIQPMIQTNNFFAALHQQNNKKWKLAVKRFIGYIKNHPNILS